MNLGSKIRDLRKLKNLTQEQLASTLNITPQAVSKWEIGSAMPDVTMLPAIASLFNVSIDELFDFDLKNIDEEVEKIRLESGRYFWNHFEKAEQILLEGLKRYPASVRLKTELFELYTYYLFDRDDICGKVPELYSEILHTSQDIFCTCRTKANMILAYKKLEQIKGEDHYGEIEKIVESLPYMYPYMIQDRMRLSAEYLKGEKGMEEAKELRIIEWQEFFISCAGLGYRYYKLGDYENAMIHFQESVDVIERFMLPGQKGDHAYPIGGTHANHAITLLQIAACRFRLGQLDGIDEIIEKSRLIYFEDLEPDEVYDYAADMAEKLGYYSAQYRELKLDDYRVLDLTKYESALSEFKKAKEQA